VRSFFSGAKESTARLGQKGDRCASSLEIAPPPVWSVQKVRAEANPLMACYSVPK
jgi:hypothetical protein